MTRYRAFGLLIESDVRLDELTAAEDASGAPDLRIVRTDIGRAMPAPDASPVFDYENDSGTVMIWPAVAGFRFRGPDLIEIQPAIGAQEEYLAFPLLGPVMAWFLHCRAMMVLHASAVRWRGRSFAFMGDKMAGKSTTAAAFLRDGARILTDDLLAFDMGDLAAPLIQPAFAQLKLSDEAAEMVAVPGAEALPLVMAGFPKRQHRLDSLEQAPSRCDALFVLQRGGEQPELEWLEPQDGFAALMRFSYNTRFANAPVEMQQRGRHFTHCVALANSSRVGQLTVPADLKRLDETVRLLGEAFGAEAP
ncbi:hypothetical protein FHS61_000558 [Altererythrobacter atlanticus]|uniref:Uncharacterized protein n=1 Tax=Croceibacterium atlanticum TaxID=1267766 RepID=A0A0F7KVJ9_9SPHN|nr:hypothetical protein [Croceibacterium atlanticum]AKH42785.1 hypothetical protein WYH_01749 [Croceibacterium atlanticum]MBB5731565.1 hypothetical protein [Croceibacterium atlanticum]